MTLPYLEPRLRAAITRGFVAGITVVSLCSCAGQGGDGLLAGAAAVDITPDEWPLPLVGSFSYRPASMAHDPLHSRSLVVQSGGSTVALAVVDSCYLPRETLDEAKDRIRQSIGLPPERILVAATHTHSAPPPAPGMGLRGIETERHEQNEERYAERLIQGIASSVIRAHARLEPAEIGWSTASLPEQVFNRRWFMTAGSVPPDPFGGTTDRVQMNPGFENPNLVEPAGPVDPEVVIVSARSRAGDPLAVLVNYSLHYVGGIPPGQVSADYFGEFARVMGVRLSAGKDFVAMLSNGTSGDVNNLDYSRPRSPREPFEQVRLVASELAEAVLGAYGAIDHAAEGTLDMAETELVLARRKPSAEILQRSRQLLANPPGTATARQIIYAQHAVDLEGGPDHVGVLLQAVRIGDVGIAALPFETFAETGLSIKRQSPLRPTFVIELANGAQKYLPTPRQHEYGGYETWLGTSVVEKRASVKVEAELLNLLRQIANVAD